MFSSMDINDFIYIICEEFQGFFLFNFQVYAYKRHECVLKGVRRKEKNILNSREYLEVIYLFLEVLFFDLFFELLLQKIIKTTFLNFIIVFKFQLNWAVER